MNKPLCFPGVHGFHYDFFNTCLSPGTSWVVSSWIWCSCWTGTGDKWARKRVVPLMHLVVVAVSEHQLQHYHLLFPCFAGANQISLLEMGSWNVHERVAMIPARWRLWISTRKYDSRQIGSFTTIATHQSIRLLLITVISHREVHTTYSKCFLMPWFTKATCHCLWNGFIWLIFVHTEFWEDSRLWTATFLGMFSAWFEHRNECIIGVRLS